MDYIEHLWNSAHPLVTHFPIALLSLVAVLCWAGLRWSTVYRHVWLLQLIGTVLLVPSVITGLRDHQPYEETSLAKLIEPHEKFGLITAAVYILATLWLWHALKTDKNAHKGKVQLALVTAGFVLLAITGYLGGQLVHETGILAN